MKAASQKSLQAKYQLLKKQYDDLLQKSQNDLIKIKMREKLLNQKIASILRQKQQNQIKLNQQIALLKKKIGSSISTSQKQLNQTTLKQQICEKHMQQISCKSKQIIQLNAQLAKRREEDSLNKNQLFNLQNIVKSLRSQIQQTKKESGQLNQKYEQSVNKNCWMQELVLKEKELETKIQSVTSLNDQLHKYKEQSLVKQQTLLTKIKQLQQSYQKQKQSYIQRYETQFSQKEANLKSLRQRLLLTNEDLKKELQKRNRLQISLQLKSQQCEQITQKYESLKKQNKSEKQVKNCLRCKQLDQQLQLHKEMIKSVRMMLKFKQIQLQGLKNK